MPLTTKKAQFDVHCDELEDQNFLNEMVNAASNFGAEKLVPKGLKAVKGAKVNVEADDFSPVTTKTAPAKKTGKKKPANDDDEEDAEVLLGLSEVADGDSKPAAKPPAQKRPRTIKQIDSSDIPEGKMTLPMETEVDVDVEEE